MSKDTFHVAFDDGRVEVFDNTASGINKFTDTLLSLGATRDTTIIGTESTGVYHLLLSQQLRKDGWNLKVINPIHTHRMIDSSLRRVKTDKHDAISIRKTLLTGVGYTYTDTPEILALKTLVQEREALCKIRASTKQRIHAHKIREKASSLNLHDSFSGPLKLLSYEIKEIEGLMDKYVPNTQKLLRSIPGVGKVTAATLVATIGDIHRFSNPEKLVAYIGLDCRVHQSGTSIHGRGYISKRGNRYLRYILFNAAFIAKRYNPDLKRFFDTPYLCCVDQRYSV
ncbi:MAG: IS110 family transposase [Candidatus Vogelbacteria bacterium]|nr:IS110 family transposase [Candidatus Vogelbacteria bacterium]